MTKSSILILLLTGLTITSLAQNIQIKVDNTEPRLGQEFNLTIETDFFDKFLKATFTDSLEVKRTYSNKNLTKTIIAKHLGPVTIGPIQFEFDGTTYFSNSITINVIPNLTDKEGVWIRKLRIDNRDYIVIEQISNIKPVTTGSGNTWTTEWKATEDNLVSLVEKPGEDIEFFNGRSGVGGHPDKGKGYSPSVSYAFKFYEIKRLPGFKGSFRLKEKYFENLPKGTEIPDIVIE